MRPAGMKTVSNTSSLCEVTHSGIPYLFLHTRSIGRTRLFDMIFLETRGAMLLNPIDFQVPSEGVTGQQSSSIQTSFWYVLEWFSVPGLAMKYLVGGTRAK